jgi:hypothetical protein
MVIETLDLDCFDADPDPGGGGEGVGQPKMCIPPGKILGTPLAVSIMGGGGGGVL